MPRVVSRAEAAVCQSGTTSCGCVEGRRVRGNKERKGDKWNRQHEQ